MAGDFYSLLPCRSLSDSSLTELSPDVFSSLTAITALYAKPLFFFSSSFFSLVVPFFLPPWQSNRQKCLVWLFFFSGELVGYLLKEQSAVSWKEEEQVEILSSRRSHRVAYCHLVHLVLEITHLNFCLCRLAKINDNWAMTVPFVRLGTRKEKWKKKKCRQSTAEMI